MDITHRCVVRLMNEEDIKNVRDLFHDNDKMSDIYYQEYKQMFWW